MLWLRLWSNDCVCWPYICVCIFACFSVEEHLVDGTRGQLLMSGAWLWKHKLVPSIKTSYKYKVMYATSRWCYSWCYSCMVSVISNLQNGLGTSYCWTFQKQLQLFLAYPNPSGQSPPSPTSCSNMWNCSDNPTSLICTLTWSLDCTCTWTRYTKI